MKFRFETPRDAWREKRRGLYAPNISRQTTSNNGRVQVSSRDAHYWLASRDAKITWSGPTNHREASGGGRNRRNPMPRFYQY